MATWADIKAEIQDEYDLSEEVFVDANELLTYANDGIEDIEKEIHSLHDKYFHTEANLTLVTGTSTYDLPSDIYALKITGVYYNDGGTKYEIYPIKDLRETVDYNTEDYYKYRIVNTTASGLKLKLYPASREDSATNVTIHYRRKANRLVDDTSVLDVIEGKSFLKQYVIEKAVKKERLTPDAPESEELRRKRQLLLASLSGMIDDDNTEVNVDFSKYEEFL